jgi:hypothetical protein
VRWRVDWRGFLALSIGGPSRAAYAWRSGVLDACHLFATTITVGGGKAALPHDVGCRWSSWGNGALVAALSFSAIE